MATSDIVCVFEDSTQHLIGRVEAWISEPVANGKHQTAPPFHQTAKLSPTLGGYILRSVPHRPAGEGWYVVIMAIPHTNVCGSLEGATQFRIAIPEGAPAEVLLTDAVNSYSAW